MSKKIVKFESDLKKFFVWAVEKEYVIKDIEGDELEWSLDLLKSINFIEPGRNKLEGFIAAVKDTYNIYRDETKVDDAKLLARDFKETPVEKKTKKEKAESTDEAPKKVKKSKAKKESDNDEVKQKAKPSKAKEVESKKVKKVESDEEDEVKRKATKAKKVVEVKEVEEDVKLEEDEIVVKVDMTLNTLDTDYLETLEYWSDDLVKAFGKPKKTGTEDDYHLYEWKIQVNDTIFAIYDWRNKEKFNDITWHISGFDDYEKNDLCVLYNYIDEFCSKDDIDIKLDFENLGESDDDE